MSTSRFKALLLTPLAVCFGFIASSCLAEIAVVDQWRYVTKKPADGWQKCDFDDESWGEGPGGFGRRGTPNARVGSGWSNSNIWLRKTFTLDAVPAKPALLIHYDEDATVYLNGKEVAKFTGYTTDYMVHELGRQAADALRVGENCMAVHCRQTDGGQFIDVHLVDADAVPQLPTPTAMTEPFKTALVTPWGEKVTADNVWQEYPRPQMARENWTNLNGQWDYAVTKSAAEKPSNWSGKILVPFALESKLGGVQKLLQADELLWYHRTFEATPEKGQRTLLNFEAVDYASEVFVNGKSVGKHVGGNTPFSFDVTDALKDGSNELVVRIDDDTEAYQLRGKQVLDPNGIWYTRVSGIWQTVWMEQVPASYIDDLVISTDADAKSITVKAEVAGGKQPGELRVTALDGDREVASQTTKGSDASLTVPNAKLWSPDSPQLYSLRVELLDGSGNAIDAVESYAGIRSVGKTQDAQGNWRLTLNGEVVFHFGPLDQGWWPDGLLTPPSDAAMLWDVQYLKDAGFNMIRKHIKVEPRRYYYHCDRLGMMLWQDQVSAGNNPPWTRLKPNPTDAQWPDAAHEQYMVELERMIDNLENHPSIVMWVPFNEAWGQHRTVEVGEWMVKRDQSRLVNIASGGNFWPAGDIADEHAYPHPAFPIDEERFDPFVKVVGEFGGHGYPVIGHLWNVDADNWGYGGLPKNEAEYLERYRTSIEKLNELRKQGIAAGVYTQTTDVEGEINGLVTYDREVIKIPAEDLKKLHEQLYQPLK